MNEVWKDYKVSIFNNYRKMKYMWSKNRIAKYLLPIILKDRKPNQYYVEPFVWGANMIDKVEWNRIWVDNNFFLIELLRAIQEWITFNKISKSLYDKIKEDSDEYYPSEVWFAWICASYSWKWFWWYAWETQTKWWIRDYQQEAINNIEKQAPNLKWIEFEYWEYNNIYIPDNSIIYCDPPYEKTTKYKDSFNHIKFWEWCREKKKEWHIIFISEYNAPDDFKCVWEKEVKSSLSANGKSWGSKNSIEKLFTI